MPTPLRGVPAILALLAGAPSALAGAPAGPPADVQSIPPDCWNAIQRVLDEQETALLQRVLAPEQWMAVPLARPVRLGHAAPARPSAGRAHWRAKLADGSRL